MSLFSMEISKPSQHYALEKELGIECIDRIGLVLRIFSSHAYSREAQLQVLRARLHYEIPFLKEWIHNSKSGEHPGFLGSGGYETDAYYELIRRQLSRIEKELEKLKMDGDSRRRQRKKRGFHSIAIAGYTNAGKSSLLNALTGEKVIVEDRMFSTLSTTTGKIENSKRKEILLTDTIGFLHGLPPFLIESFMSTIEEIYLSDLILLVIDSSDPMEIFEKKFKTSSSILFPTADPKNVIVVLSKRDLCQDINEKEAFIRNNIRCMGIIPISVISNEGLDILKGSMLSAFDFPIEMSFKAPQSGDLETLISWLYDHEEVLSVDYDCSTIVHLLCREKDHSLIVRNICALGGVPIV